MKEKLYPFSVVKNELELAYVRNCLENKMHDLFMESHMTEKQKLQFDKCEEMLDQLGEVENTVICHTDRWGKVAWLTGKQYAEAKRFVNIAHEVRDAAATKRAMH